MALRPKLRTRSRGFGLSLTRVRYLMRAFARALLCMHYCTSSAVRAQAAAGGRCQLTGQTDTRAVCISRSVEAPCWSECWCSCRGLLHAGELSNCDYQQSRMHPRCDRNASRCLFGLDDYSVSFDDLTPLLRATDCRLAACLLQ